MLNDISIGRYYRKDSILHGTDPRVKAILYIVYLVAIFIIRTPVALAVLTAVTLLQAVMAKITPRIMWLTVKPVLPIAMFILLINIFTIRQGNPVFSWRIIRITDCGAMRAVLTALRLVFLIISTSILLTLTTTPLKISDALESIFAPLKAIHIPVHEMAMMMSIALRFIPTLVSETDKIMKAQMARGADFESGNIIQRVKNMVPLLVPLFISAFRRANDLALAMEARCYHGGEGRTQMKPLRYQTRDYAAYGVLMAYLVCSIGLRVCGL